MKAYITIIDNNDEVRVDKYLLTPYRIEHNDASRTTDVEFRCKLRLTDESLLKGEFEINGCI